MFSSEHTTKHQRNKMHAIQSFLILNIVYCRLKVVNIYLPNKITQIKHVASTFGLKLAQNFLSVKGRPTP